MTFCPQREWLFTEKGKRVVAPWGRLEEGRQTPVRAYQGLPSKRIPHSRSREYGALRAGVG